METAPSQEVEAETSQESELETKETSAAGAKKASEAEAKKPLLVDTTAVDVVVDLFSTKRGPASPSRGVVGMAVVTHCGAVKGQESLLRRVLGGVLGKKSRLYEVFEGMERPVGLESEPKVQPPELSSQGVLEMVKRDSEIAVV